MSIFRACLALAIVVASLQFARAQDATTKPAEPVDFRKLKEVMPAELLGIKRTEVNGDAAKENADSSLINNVVFQAGLSFWFPTSFEYTTFR